jgi:hypothetical protein
MKEIAKQLEEEWKEKHYRDAEASFALKDDGYVRTNVPSFFQKSEQPETVLAAKKE